MPGAHDIRAGRAYVEIGTSDRYLRGLRRARAKLNQFGRAVARIGAAVAAGTAAIGAPLIAAARKFASMGDELDKMAQRTGASVEFLSQLNYAAELGGTNIATMEVGIRRLQRAALDAERGLSTATEAFNRLGIEIHNTEGGLKNTEALFMESATALARVENNTEKAALATMLFGRSGTLLLPMLRSGEAGLKGLFEEAERLGVVMSTKDAAAAAELTDQMFRLSYVLKMGVFRIGRALWPVLDEIATRIVKIVKSVGDWLDKNHHLVRSLADIKDTLRIVWAEVQIQWEELKTDFLAIFGEIRAAVLSYINTCVSEIKALVADTKLYLREAGAAIAELGERIRRAYQQLGKKRWIVGGPGFGVAIPDIKGAWDYMTTVGKLTNMEERLGAARQQYAEDLRQITGDRLEMEEAIANLTANSLSSQAQGLSQLRTEIAALKREIFERRLTRLIEAGFFGDGDGGGPAAPKPFPMGKDPFGAFRDWLETARDEFAKGFQRTYAAVGTFGLREARALGGEPMAVRTAAATEACERHLREILRKTDEGGGILLQ